MAGIDSPKLDLPADTKDGYKLPATPKNLDLYPNLLRRHYNGFILIRPSLSRNSVLTLAPEDVRVMKEMGYVEYLFMPIQ